MSRGLGLEACFRGDFFQVFLRESSGYEAGFSLQPSRQPPGSHRKTSNSGRHPRLSTKYRSHQGGLEVIHIWGGPRSPRGFPLTPPGQGSWRRPMILLPFILKGLTRPEYSGVLRELATSDGGLTSDLRLTALCVSHQLCKCASLRQPGANLDALPCTLLCTAVCWPASLRCGCWPTCCCARRCSAWRTGGARTFTTGGGC